MVPCGPARWWRTPLGRRRSLVAAVSLLAVATMVGVGYFLAARTPSVSTVTVTVYVGDHEASGEAAGWWYGVETSVSTWRAADGTRHQGGWPTCLDRIGTHRTVVFGWVPTTTPGVGSWRDVVYVGCSKTTVALTGSSAR